MEVKTEIQTPANHRAKWSITELELLLEEIKSGLSLEIIAEKHHRTIGAIKYKLYRHIIQILKNNPSTTMDYLISITSLNKKEIMDGLKKLNYNYDDSNNDSNNDFWQILIKIVFFQIVIYCFLCKFSNT
jgi:hypothetical protein